MDFTNYQLPDGTIVPVDATAAKGAAVIGFTLKGGRVVQARRCEPQPKMVRHRFNVWIDVPAVSGDGWSKYPDYSAAEIGRQMRRLFHENGWDDSVVVEHSETEPIS